MENHLFSLISQAVNRHSSVSSASGRLVVAFLGTLFVAITGCQTSGGGVYTFHTMPSEMVAVRRENSQTLDLTRLARAAVDSDLIDRGDVIEVVISASLDEKDSVKIPVRVNEAGFVNLPEVGKISVAGLGTQEAEAAIFEGCIQGEFFKSPNVTVTMKKQRTNRVTVMGAVKKPGVYELPRGQSDLLAALNAAEGLEKDAGTIVEIRNSMRANGSRQDPVASENLKDVDTVGMTNDRGDPINQEFAVHGMATGESTFQTVRIDLVKATKQGESEAEGYLITDGGVVNIEKRDPEPLHVMGLVRKPDRYEFPLNEDVRVTDAISKAGGTSVTVADKIFVIRRKANGSDTAVIKVSLKQAKTNSQANLRLAPGDVVSVEQTPATVMMEALNIVRFGISSSLPIPGL